MESSSGSTEAFVVMECDNNSTVTNAAFTLIVQGYLSVACVILGTIGNLYGVRSVHVTNFDKNRGVVLAVSVLALAFWDTLLLWSAFFYYAIKMVDPWPSQKHQLNLITPCFHAFSQISNTASIWCVVAITAQRFMATRDPFRCSRSAALLHSFRERRTSSISFFACYANRRLLRMPLAISLFAILANVPAFFELYAVVCYNALPDGGRTYEHALQIAPLRQSPTYMFWYRFVFRMMITNVGPNTLIILMTSLTVVILKGSNRSRRQLFRLSDSLLDRYSSRETMQTMISIVLVTKFLLLRSLSFICDIVEIALGERLKEHYDIFIHFAELSNLFILVNSATNCLIFLKASSWLNDKITERKTLKRKKTIIDTNQISADRVTVLSTTWEAAKRFTNGQIGLNVLYAMVRKHPSLLDPMRPSPFAPGGETHIVTLIGLPCKRSFDLMGQGKYQEIADRITTFMDEIIEMMKHGAPESCLTMRIRRVGAIHHAKRVRLSSAVWKEFKASLLAIIGECEYATDEERETALEAWGTFISFIIREMKMGVWAIGESIGGV